MALFEDEKRITSCTNFMHVHSVVVKGRVQTISGSLSCRHTALLIGYTAMMPVDLVVISEGSHVHVLP